MFLFNTVEETSTKPLRNYLYDTNHFFTTNLFTDIYHNSCTHHVCIYWVTHEHGCCHWNSGKYRKQTVVFVSGKTILHQRRVMSHQEVILHSKHTEAEKHERSAETLITISTGEVQMPRAMNTVCVWLYIRLQHNKKAFSTWPTYPVWSWGTERIHHRIATKCNYFILR